MSDVINSINTTIDDAFELSQLPKLGRWAAGGVGRGFDALVGTNIAPVVEQIGGDLPRMTAEAMLTLPMAASGAGTPAAAAMWMNRLRKLGQIAGYGSAGVSGWEHTGSPIGGAINMATLGAGNKLFTAADRGGLDVGLRGQELAEGLAGFKPRATPALDLAKNTLTPDLSKGAVESVLDAKTLFQQLVGGTGRGVTDVATGVGLAEASRQASMSVGPNGVGLDDEARNPLTAENIAGNVMNALPMAVGAVSAARAKFRPKQLSEMADWARTREGALKAEAGYNYEGPLTPTQWHDAKGEVPYGLAQEERFGGLTDPLDEALAKKAKLAFTSNAISKSIGAHFTALEQQLAENNGEGAEQTYRMIHRAFQGGQDLMTPEGRGYMEQRIKEHDATARQMVPGSAPELVGFVDEVNKTIGMWNAEWKKAKAVLDTQAIDPSFVVRTGDDLARFNAAKKVAQKVREEQADVRAKEGKTWSEAAADASPEKIQLLEKRGLIEPLTEDWFKSAMTEELKRSSPEEAYQIVLQKAVNEKLGQLPAAIEEYKKLPPPDTTEFEAKDRMSGNASQKAIDEIDKKHYTNYLKFPAELREELFNRDAQVRGRGEFGLNGRLHHRFPVWRDALDLAARTYNPEADTIEVYVGKGKTKVVGSDYWTQLDENGDYVNEVPSRQLPTSEGGTPHSGNKNEMTLTDLTAKDAPTADALERLDEEMYKSSQAEEVVPGSFAAKDAVLESTGKGGEQVVPEQGLYLPETAGEKTGPEVDVYEVKKKVQGRLAELSNDEAYYAGQGAFNKETSPDRVSKKKRLFKNAVTAALEDSFAGKGVEIGEAGKAFLGQLRELGDNPAGKSEKDALRRALKSYFGFQVEPSFKGAVKQVAGDESTRPDRQRLRHIVQALTDDKQVEMAKSAVMAQGGETGVAKPSIPVEPKTMPDWVREAMVRQGLDPKRPLNDFDIQNPSVREAVAADPTLTPEQKSEILVKGSFSEAKPSEGVGAEVPQKDLLVNTQKPGAFTEDVYRTVRHNLTKVLGDAGYSGSIRDMYVEMAVAIAQTAPNDMVDFYSIIGGKGSATGLANVDSSGPGRGQVGLGFEGIDKKPGFELHYAQRLVATLAHEVSHIDDFIVRGMIDAPDAFSNIRRRLRENLNDLAELSSPDQRHAMLSTLKDALIPKEFQWQEVQKDGRLYGAHSGEEFVAVVNQMLAQSLLHGKKGAFKNALEVLDYSPTEVREYGQGMFRSLHDVMLSMQDSLAHPTIRAAAGKEKFEGINPFLTSTIFGAVVNSAREGSLLRHADVALANAREFSRTLSPGAIDAPPRPSPAMWLQTEKDIQKMYAHIDETQKPGPMNAERVKEAVDLATQVMSKQAYDKAHAEGKWMGMFAPFAQRMEAMRTGGFDIARPMADLAIGLEGGITRLRSMLLGDYVKRGASGLVEYNAENPLLKRIAEEKTGPWRNAVNEMSAWQQDKNDGKALFVQDEKGAYIPDPKNKGGVAAWEKVRSRLSPEDQNFVAAQIVAMDKSNVKKGDVLRAAMREELEYRVGLTLMASNRGMRYEQAGPYGKQVTSAIIAREEAVRAKNGGAVQVADEQLAQLLPTPQARSTMESFFGGKDGVLEQLFTKSEIIAGRTGHRSEALVGDWILRVVPPQGGPAKFVAERNEHAANYRMRELKKEGYTQAGEIVHKSKLADYADFENHDVTLQKFSSKVTDAYNRMVGEVELSHGAEVAAQLREFAPSSVIAAEAAKTGLDKYTATRKNTVDRTKYDYIDGELASATKLAASVAYKSVEQQKNLMLADPRSKQFPSFRTAVDEHFAEMMAPTSKWSQEVKLASSAYFMGANVSSAVINAAQSVTSLVPVLIQQAKDGMGPVAAWKLLGKATADAFSVTGSKNWETRAALAERVSPEKQTLQESKDALYRKRVLEGGIDHGIIQDTVFTGMDQNALMLAKFGHGDYAPLSKGEMIRNPVNYAARLSMKPFGWIEQINNKISFMAGVEQGYNQGLRGDALYSYARRVQTLSTYGGGKANAPGLVAKLSNPYTRSAVGVVNNLQQYGYGMVTTYAQLLKDSIGNSPGLSQMEKRQAQKALGTMVMTQVATAGALGLPFVGAALTGLEKVFGVPANQAVREGLAALGGDGEDGAVFAETALNGLGNQLFGLDVSSRLGVSNLLGTSSYRGFNLSDMAGPTPSVVANMVEGLSLFGGGEPVKAAKALVPNAFKTVVEMTDSKAKYGEYGMRDSGGDLLYKPTNGEAVAYMVGVRPRALTQKRQAQAMLKGVEDRTQKSVSREQRQISDALLAGDSAPALRYVQETVYHDPTVNPKDLLRSLVNRGVDSQMEKDLLATGSRASEQERGQVARTFGNDVVTRQSEVQRALLGAQLGARVGLEPDAKSFQRAALVDMLVRQRGMVRSEAVRLAGFLD